MPTVTIASGGTVHYQEFGDQHHPVLLLIEGLGAHMLGWREEFCRLLADGGFRVIRFDNRDVGLSARYPDGGYGLTDLAQDTAGLLDVLGIDAAHVVGQSMGGMVAVQLVAARPDLVRSLALIYTAPNNEFIIGAEAVQDRLTVPANPSREEAVELLLRNESVCASTAYRQDVEWLRELGGLMYDRSFDPAGIERQVQAVLSGSDRSALAAAIAVPTTIMHGATDQLIDPAGSVRLHELIPHSVLTIIPGMGHELPKECWPLIVQSIHDNARRTLVSASYDEPTGDR